MSESDDAPSIEFDTVSLLVPKAKSGSLEARDELLAHVQDYLALMARNNAPANLRGKIAASDIVQQSLAQVIQGFENFRGDTKGEFFGWLKAIVSNEVKKFQRDFHRAKRNVELEQRLDGAQSGSYPGVFPVDNQPTPGTNAIAAEQLANLRQALLELPEDYAEVIQLRSLDRLSFKEVAARMNRSFDSVTKLWYRAIVKLQQELETNNETPKRK